MQQEKETEQGRGKIKTELRADFGRGFGEEMFARVKAVRLENKQKQKSRFFWGGEATKTFERSLSVNDDLIFLSQCV